MATQIFVNLPVKDLQRSIAFFTALGYTFNLNYTNEDATCMVIGDARKSTEVMRELLLARKAAEA